MLCSLLLQGEMFHVGVCGVFFVRGVVHRMYEAPLRCAGGGHNNIDDRK